MADDRRPSEQPDNSAPPAGRREGAPADHAASSLVWPPPDEELDAWEVVALRDGPADREPARPTPVAAPADSGAVVVHAVREPQTRAGAKPIASPGPGPRVAVPPSTSRLGAGEARLRSATVPVVVVPLVVALSAAAGFMAARWTGATSDAVRPGGEPSAVVTIESRVPGLQVRVNGEPLGVTPLRLPLPGGETRIEVDSPPPAGTSPAGTAGHGGSALGVAGSLSAIGGGGSVLVRSTPPGATVVLEGRRRGTTPITIEGVPPGLHEVEVGDVSGSVLRRVVVNAGGLSTLDVDLRRPTPSGASSPTVRRPSPAGVASGTGYLSVRSPIPLQVLLQGRPLGTSQASPIQLPPGTHDVQLVAEVFEFATTRRVQVSPGATAALAVEVPSGLASFDAEPRAEVWVGGIRLGETPLDDVELPLGVHEVVFRHPQLGERRETVTVRARTPLRLRVSLNR